MVFKRFEWLSSTCTTGVGDVLRTGVEHTASVLGSAALAGIDVAQTALDVVHRAAGNETYRDLWRDNRFDELTHIITRRRITREVDRFAQVNNQREFFGAFIDVVGLKEVNDTYTHAMGDNLLQVAGWGLKQLFHLPKGPAYREQPSALVGRWGGDEFIALMPADAPLFDHLGKSLVFRTLKELQNNSHSGKDRQMAVWNLKQYYTQYMNNENNRHIKPEVRAAIRSLLDAGVDKVEFAYNIGSISIEDGAKPAIEQFMAKYSTKYAQRVEE